MINQVVSRGTFFPSSASQALSIPRRTPSRSSTDTPIPKKNKNPSFAKGKIHSCWDSRLISTPDQPKVRQEDLGLLYGCCICNSQFAHRAPKVVQKVRYGVLHREAEASSHMSPAHLRHILEWERCQNVPNKLNEVYTVNSTEEYWVLVDQLGILVGSNWPLGCPLGMRKFGQRLPRHQKGPMNMVLQLLHNRGDKYNCFAT
ncbi:hypothetical protein DSO57_1039779 [Entomophthora muscae]|uniref:Uncharacterized protein n=1 Tax=Entomophthora muscae TaxID=34485 RepID=A0ACC2T666_9FUNG|nr:hypothetical protein DSO57_1039779 [Entomophthora muscae]